MFVKRFFEPTLAQTSYLIGCTQADEAIVIDPNRDAEQYVQAAAAEGLRIAHVTETHIHADYVSGSRELAARTGATLYLSAEGDADWQYEFAREAGATLIKEGDRIVVGRVRLDVVHTPGHTPEHLVFLVTDGAAADEPIAAITGDFIFVGDVGRPDLLERAANIQGTMQTSARALFESLQRFSTRPDWLQIWPGHGAGSACGKGISAIPQSTLGYERRFNWAFQIGDEAEFVKFVLAGQPEPPKYFAEMKRLNKSGPPVLNGFRRPAELDVSALEARLQGGTLIVDTRAAHDFAVSHVPGTINIPLDRSFTTWAGWIVPFTTEFCLIVDDRSAGPIDEAVRELSLIGLDRIGGYFGASVIDHWVAEGRRPGTLMQIGVRDLQESLVHSAVTVVDVRNRTEWDAGHIPGARHIPLGHLAERLDELPRTKPVVVHCASGRRSVIASSLLRAHGVEQVINLTGGFNEWQEAGLPVTTGE